MSNGHSLAAECVTVSGLGNLCDRIAQIDGPDDIIKSGLLGVFGPGLIVCGFIFFNLAASWLGIARTSVKAGRGFTNAARSGLSSLRGSTPRAATIGLVLSVIILLLQLGWIYLGYYVGNSISVIFQADDRTTFPQLDEIPGLLRWDAFSKGFVLANAVGLILVYARRLGEGVSSLLALPGYFYGFCGIVGGALNLLMLKLGSPVEGVDGSAITYMFTLGFSGCFYVFATRYALEACGWMRGFWGLSLRAR